MQSITFLEYFSDLRRNQKLTKMSTMEYVRQYANKRCNLVKQGIGVVSWINTLCKVRNESFREVSTSLALLELNLAIEDDLMEYVAELGLETYKAVKEDKKRADEERDYYFTYGYSPTNTKPSAVKKLKVIYELEFVRKNERPLVMIDTRNPFLFIDEDDSPFKDDDRSCAVMTINNTPKEPKDWDKLSDDEWKDFKEAEAEKRLHDRIAKMAQGAKIPEADTEKALNLLDEYPERFEMY